MARSQPKTPQRPPLLATTTNEPFQPVRLYYAVPDARAVRAKLRRIACVQEVPTMDCWEWLFANETAGLRFPGTYQDVPETMRPIILGRIRFPRATAMTLQTNSFPRALEGARFFGARLGNLAVALRIRVINRCFAADEGDIQNLASMLDRDVVVGDPREAELVVERLVQKAPSKAEALRRFIQGDFPGEDVPLVEDLPLYPEEETPDLARRCFVWEGQGEGLPENPEPHHGRLPHRGQAQVQCGGVVAVAAQGEARRQGPGPLPSQPRPLLTRGPTGPETPSARA
jgi:hypothetical protein